MEAIDFDSLSDKEIKKIKCSECEKKVKINTFGEIEVVWYEDEDETEEEDKYLCESCYEDRFGLSDDEEEGYSDYIEKINKD